MAHLIEPTPAPTTRKTYKFKFPSLSGKFGLSFFIGKKEVFIGVAIAEVELETVVRKTRKKVLQPSKSTFMKI